MSCPYYTYAQRGRNCYPITSALTSNEKFLPPLDPLYFQPYTTMVQYPGMTQDFITSVGDYAHPEEIKAYFGKSFGPKYPSSGSHPSAPNPIEDICPGCKLLQSDLRGVAGASTAY